ncbi:Uncharacterized protein TPAR_06097 [Tolypocladium paradoxum]|uniref:Alpha-type protein kinase domain-containing protein n=1 Tax=Tolypocladium paradoxum TaxID=94208 RepID=A0A2S4KU47_9HYPO|nr:Uncharacterized protein TPAR_06097 [Tolypocladium paradoxum]
MSRPCAACGRNLPQSSYTANQYSKGSGVSRCVSCVHGHHSDTPSARQSDSGRYNQAGSASIPHSALEDPFAQGAFRWVAEGTYISGSRQGQACVVKWFKTGAVFSDDYFTLDIKAVDKALEIVNRFNHLSIVNKVVKINVPEVWRFIDDALDERSGQKILCEPFIENYQKFNSNTGWNDDSMAWGEAMQALSHFSYHVSGGNYVLCDLQGGIYQHELVLSDPVILSRNREYGVTDLGPDGVVPFPDEKVRYEVATMRYVAANTIIPVPHVYYSAPGAENPTGLGPFIIMDYIEHHQNMSEQLLDPERPIDERPILDPEISEEKLEFLYAQMANILLQLSTLKFPRIGSLVEEEGQDSASVKGRPLIENMNDIVVHTDAPPSILPSQTYASADEWYSALADMHLAQLAFQHNDAVEDEDDARDKYTARQLFRNLAIEKRLVSDLSRTDGFRLFSEDFRPTNVLLDKDLRVVGVIDWEFAYAAPAQFSFDPPWWLLLEEPECWTGGYLAWMEAYEPRLQTFLRVLEAEENKMAAADLAEKVSGLSLTNSGRAEPPLSWRMRESWEKRTWMLSYAARKSWAFDFIWWKFLDETYFGPNENQDYEARLELLSEPQRKVMEPFVARKMEESSNPQRDQDPVLNTMDIYSMSI